MTARRQHRCVHCGTSYLYQGSGPGCNTPLNDGLYCPECKQVVLKALSSIPRKFERVWVPTSEVPFATILEWAKEEDEARAIRRARGELVAQRVCPPLFNLDTGESDRSGYVMGKPPYKAVLYEYRYWPGEEAEGTVRVEIDRPVTPDAPTVWDILNEELPENGPAETPPQKD